MLSYFELESETYVGVICGEFLANGINGTLKGGASLLHLKHLHFLISVYFQIN